MAEYVRHLFVMAEEPGPPVVEEDEMLDFEDVGGVYNSAPAAAANTAALQSFLNGRIAEPGIWLQFSGPKSYANKRQPGIAYLDLAGGPILVPVGPAFTFKGMAGAEIVGRDAATPTTPVFQVQRVPGARTHQRFQDLTIRNTEGSGIKFVSDPPDDPLGTGPNALTSLDGMKILDIGTSVISPTIDCDGWTDLETACYGIYMENADGLFLTNSTIMDVNGHGIIAKRWHEGGMSSEVRECTGSGLKGQQINGTTLSLRAESNKCWGLHVRDCGMPRLDATDAWHGSQSATNAWEVWLEGNNYRDTQITGAQSYRWRQAKLESSSRITMGSQSGWQYGKIDVDESVRRTCHFVDAHWIDPSVDGSNAVLRFDSRANDVLLPGDTGGSNFTTAWPSAPDRPVVTINGDYLVGTQELQVQIQPGSYNTVDRVATSSAWWKLWRSSVNPAPPSTWMWDCELSVTSGGYDYCVSREVDDNTRQPAYLGSIGINAPSGSGGPMTFALYNGVKRKFSGRFHVEISRQMEAIIFVYILGMEDVIAPIVNEPQSIFTLTIHSFRLYTIGA